MFDRHPLMLGRRPNPPRWGCFGDSLGVKAVGLCNTEVSDPGELWLSSGSEKHAATGVG